MLAYNCYSSVLSPILPWDMPTLAKAAQRYQFCPSIIPGLCIAVLECSDLTQSRKECSSAPKAWTSVPHRFLIVSIILTDRLPGQDWVGSGEAIGEAW